MSHPVALPKPLSRQPSLALIRSRTPSRTQLRHANAVRRLFSDDGVGNEPPQDQYHMALKDDKNDNDRDTEAESSKQAIRKEELKKATGSDEVSVRKKRVVLKVKPQPVGDPYMRFSLNAVGVDIIADTANMETLMGHRDYLRASFVTPESMLHRIKDKENVYHVWAAVTLALDERKGGKNDLEEVVEVATAKFMVEMGSALLDCLKPNLPHYTFVDPRRIYTSDGREEMVRQAVSIVEGFQKKGVSRERVYISIPATEGGLEIARTLKDKHSIRTNITFVTGLAQASACIEAGADAISMSIGPNLQYYENRRGTFSHMLKPHPGFENVKAVACYIKHNELETKLIATDLRYLEEVQQLSCVRCVCFADWQMENAKWHRTRIARPPNGKSEAVLRAKHMPYPPTVIRDGDFRYLALMSAESRRETLAILDAGLRTWSVCTTRIVDAIRNEIKRRMDIASIPLSRELPITNAEVVEFRGEARAARSRSLANTRLSLHEQQSNTITFPGFEDEVEIVMSPVPPSPLLQDLDDFVSSSDDEFEDMEIVMF